MKRNILSAMVLLSLLFLVGADAGAKVADKEGKEEVKGGKKVLANFNKGETFSVGLDGKTDDISLSEKHVVGKERIRCKVVGGGGIGKMTRNLDWSGFNYVVFNVFVEGDKPWSGMVLVGDDSSSASWTKNYVEISLSLKPGENKEVHVNVDGLFCTRASRALNMKNMRIFIFFPGDDSKKIGLYFGNIYLVNEEE